MIIDLSAVIMVVIKRLIRNPVLLLDEVGLTYDEYDKFIKTYPKAADILNNGLIKAT